MSSPQREYERGYHNSLEGKSYNDGSNGLLAILTLGLDGDKREHSDSYAEGFRDGKEDRNR